MDIRLPSIFASMPSFTALIQVSGAALFGVVRRPAFWLACALLWVGCGLSQTAQGAVAIMYHRFGASSYPSTNITIAQFEGHIEAIKRGPYKVIPVTELAAALKEGREPPKNAIVITIDDAYQSVYTEAWPRLQAANLPFAVFVSAATIGHGQNMSWDQIRELRDSGVFIGNHGDSHRHMAHDDSAQNILEIERAKKRFVEEMGPPNHATPHIFAYPYGETSNAVKNAVIETGFDVAFGQHSGAIGGASDRYYLPRFSLNEQYGGRDRFAQIIGALPLPVHDLTPSNPLIGGTFGPNPPAFGFTVGSALVNLDNLACYHSAFGAVPFTRLGTHRFEVRFAKPFAPGRSRINCTMPGPDRRTYWFGVQFLTWEK
ncbi:MAG: peptidoglycan/xylan/chitin deacetylase (PgdA/CDA1 family) [Alphaproteobacteria bacterium]|jgi:peptidoglycan/xylan/chitin deacetylase (PgdA/CDA1 family)